MAQTVRRAIEGRYPSCYLLNRIKERRAKVRALRFVRQRKLDEPEDFVCYSDSDSEEETPTQQHKILCTSYNFVDYVRSREILAPEPRSVDPSYATSPVNLDNMDKVFCSQWLSDRHVIFGTSCNKLMVYDVRSRSLDAIPTLRLRRAPDRYTRASDQPLQNTTSYRHQEFVRAGDIQPAHARPCVCGRGAQRLGVITYCRMAPTMQTRRAEALEEQQKLKKALI